MGRDKSGVGQLRLSSPALEPKQHYTN